MTFYTDLRDDTVAPAIAEFGQSATLTQPGAATGPDYDPTPGTPTSYPVKVLPTSLTVVDKTGSLVQENDVKYMLSMEGDPQPDLKGTLTVGVITYQITKLEPKEWDGTVVFYNVFCRK